MLEYEFENTLNTLKENHNSIIIEQTIKFNQNNNNIGNRNDMKKENLVQNNSGDSGDGGGGGGGVDDGTTIDSDTINNFGKSIARKRWKILAKAIKRKESNNLLIIEPSNGGGGGGGGDGDGCCFDSSSGSSSPSTPPPSITTVLSSKTIDFNINSGDPSKITSTSTTTTTITTTTNNINNLELEDELLASVRRFTSFDLMEKNQNHLSVNDKELLIGNPENWFTYKIKIENFNYFVNIHHMKRLPSALDLMGFNNTGNICIWPSEEALAFYCLNILSIFKNKKILELGGGMTCLAGLFIAKYGNPDSVHLTDGNRFSIENVKRTIRLNDLNCYCKCSILKWEQYKHNNNNSINNSNYNNDSKFDYILSADCIFFDESRTSLVDTIWYNLSDANAESTAFIMAPKRGKTLDLFVKYAIGRGFLCEILYKYNDIIWQRHLDLLQKSSTIYDENLHYPILIKLTKKH